MINNSLIIRKILNIYNLPVSIEKIFAFLDQYPHSGSIKSIEQALRNFGLGCNIVIGDVKDVKSLADLNLPIIAHFKKEKKFILVKKVSSAGIKYYDPDSKQTNIPLNEFENKVSGYYVIPIALPHRLPLINQLLVQIIKIYNREALLLLLLLTNLLYVGVFGNSSELIILLLINYIGLIISYFLMRMNEEEVRINIDQVCSSLGGSCHDLTTKKDQKIFNLFTFSELGFIYFLFGVICINLQLSEVLYLLLIINAPTLIFGLYSAYYQIYILKNFCLFCSIVVVLFYSEALILYNSQAYQSIQFGHLIIVGGISGLVSLLVLFVMKSLTNYKLEIKTKQVNLSQFKYSEQILECQIRNTSNLPEDSSILIFGRNQTKCKHNLIVVINPFCPPCKRAFVSLKKLMIGSREDELSVIVVFSINLIHEYNSLKHQVSRKIILEYLYGNPGTEHMISLLNNWFDADDKEQWIDLRETDYYSAKRLAEVDNILKIHKKWITENQITHTPGFILNNKLIPRGYTAEDLIYLL